MVVGEKRWSEDDGGGDDNDEEDEEKSCQEENHLDAAINLNASAVAFTADVKHF